MTLDMGIVMAIETRREMFGNFIIPHNPQPCGHAWLYAPTLTMVQNKMDYGPTMVQYVSYKFNYSNV